MDVMTNRPPVAVIGSEIVANLPLTVKFNAGGSTDPENDIILGFIWDFGDGSPVDESTKYFTESAVINKRIAEP